MPRPVPVVIFGAGGHGRDFVGIIDALNAREPSFELVGFVDDGVVDEEAVCRLGSRVLGDRSALAHLDAKVVLGMAEPRARRAVADAIAAGADSPTLIHPQVTVSRDVELDEGCVLHAGVRLGTNIRLGRHVHMDWNATVGHDARIGDFATLTPGVHVAGGVTIERGVFLGAGASVLQGVRIGADAVIGSGAVVLHDVEAGATVVGVPAHPLDR